MKETAKAIWRFVYRIKHRRLNVMIAPSARFNNKNRFGGFNKIEKRTSVSGSKIGRYTYINYDCFLCDCIIGSFCSIAYNVRISKWTHPTKGFISSSPVFYSIDNCCGKSFVNKNLFNEEKTIDGYDCIIGNDVWIGADVIIIGGVSIGNGAIIGTGSVVTKDVPPYSIVGGVPAKVIRYRYTEEEIKILERIKWWNKPDEWLEENAMLFSNEKEFLKKFAIDE